MVVPVIFHSVTGTRVEYVAFGVVTAVVWVIGPLLVLMTELVDEVVTAAPTPTQ